MKVIDLSDIGGIAWERRRGKGSFVAKNVNCKMDRMILKEKKQ